MDSHYTAISSDYNYLYEPIHEADTPMYINKLQLTPDDLLLDIGAATGQQAHLIWKEVGLKNPVTCVEPCQAFFEHSSKLDGIVPVMQTAEQFCDELAEQRSQRPFNKVLLCAVVHHIHDIAKCLGKIFDYLPKNGVCFIIHLSFTKNGLLSLPLTAVLLQQVKDVQPNPLDTIIPFVKARHDVIVQVTNEMSSYRIPKCRWYYMIRNRFWSFFRSFTDEDIEESIKELDNGKLKGVKDDDLITVAHEFVGVTVTKK